MINNLNKILKEKKMTAYALSKAAGVTPSTIYNYIKRGQIPALDVALKISETLGKNIVEIWSLK